MEILQKERSKKYQDDAVEDEDTEENEDTEEREEKEISQKTGDTEERVHQDHHHDEATDDDEKKPHNFVRIFSLQKKKNMILL